MKLRINIILLELGLMACVVYIYLYFWFLLGEIKPVFTFYNLLPNSFMALIIGIAIYKLMCFAKHSRRDQPLVSSVDKVDVIDTGELPSLYEKKQAGSWLLATILIQGMMSLISFIYIIWNLLHATIFYLANRYLLIAMGLIMLISAILTFFYVREMEKRMQ